MYEIIINEGTGLESDDIHDMDSGYTAVLSMKSSEDLMQLAESLEPYARKDFAVRYGHLEDGNAKA